MYTQLLDDSVQILRNRGQQAGHLTVNGTKMVLKSEWSIAKQFYDLALGRVKTVASIRNAEDVKRYFIEQPEAYCAASKNVLDECRNLIDGLEELRLEMAQQRKVARAQEYALAEDIEESVSSISDKAAETVSKAAESVSKMAESVSKNFKETANEATETVDEVAESVDPKSSKSGKKRAATH